MKTTKISYSVLSALVLMSMIVTSVDGSSTPTDNTPPPSSIQTFDASFEPYIGLQTGMGVSEYSQNSVEDIGPGKFNFASSGGSTRWLYGITGGFERRVELSSTPWLWQVGLSLNQYSKGDIKGSSSQGMPGAQSNYTYQYKFGSASLLLVNTLMLAVNERWHPYGSLGVGYARNEAQDYDVSAEQTGSDVPVTFASKTSSGLAYQLGLGVGYQVNPQLRLGLGYRFTSLGKVELGSGSLAVGQSVLPYSGSSLGQNHLYDNSVECELSYLL